ncbi:placenta-specific gene 8 protein [Aplysia californica]|uniref:Placenta-specific gene 8 protein n=1 Tax=Aplysia californica TaxID=6500 RepID=A0ABM0K643_APLCA|nr:placenta-specific gene 8 protein [Aplysia californica]
MAHQQQPVGFAPAPAGNTTVIVNQPMSDKSQVRDWGTGVFSCFDDMKICLCGWCCPLCLGWNVATDLGETGIIVCCVPSWLTVVRTKLRTQQKIQGDVCNDCMMSECCGICVLCQVAREIKTCKANGTLNNTV